MADGGASFLSKTFLAAETTSDKVSAAASPSIGEASVPTEDAKSMWEWYSKHHFLSYYITCIHEGKTISKEVGEPIQHRFSLKQWIAHH